MGELALYGAAAAFLGVMMGLISAATRKLVLAAIGFAVAIGGFLVFFGL